MHRRQIVPSGFVIVTDVVPSPTGTTGATGATVDAGFVRNVIVEFVARAPLSDEPHALAASTTVTRLTKYRRHR